MEVQIEDEPTILDRLLKTIEEQSSRIEALQKELESLKKSRTRAVITSLSLDDKHSQDITHSNEEDPRDSATMRTAVACILQDWKKSRST